MADETNQTDEELLFPPDEKSEENDQLQEEPKKQDNASQKSDEDEFQPPVSKSLQDDKESSKEEKRFWYELRQINKRIGRLEKNLLPGDDYDDTGETSYGDDTADSRQEDVEEKEAAVLSELEERERILDVKLFLNENPEFIKYKDRIEKTALHPAYKYIPVDFIAKGFAYQEAEKIGAEKGIMAKKKAENSKVGGSPVVPYAGKKSVWELSREEFNRLSDRIRRAKRS